MAEFLGFISHLLNTGEARLRGEPVCSSAERGAVLQLLKAAHEEDVLDLAGPTLPFAASAALAGGQFLAWACWFLMRQDKPPEIVEANLRMDTPRSPSEHLSADVCLKFASAVHRRARATNPSDVLTRKLEETLRRWPLSGALSDIAAPPEANDFGGHPGLLLLYAERLAIRPRPAWLTGPVMPVADLVFTRRGISFVQATLAQTAEANS